MVDASEHAPYDELVVTLVFADETGLQVTLTVGITGQDHHVEAITNQQRNDRKTEQGRHSSGREGR